MDHQFLTADQVIEINQNQISLYGGEFSLDDPQKLDAAIHAPQATFNGKYLNDFPFEMAAAYLISLSQDHAFRDGNKRTGYASALVFLDWHGWSIEADDEAQEKFVLEVAKGIFKKADATSFFEKHAVLNSEHSDQD